MGPLARLADYIERRAQVRAYLKASGGNFDSRLSQEERRVLRERREEARRLPLVQTEADAEEIAQADMRIISDRYRPELLFDDREFFGFKPGFSTQGFFEDRGCFLKAWKEDDRLASSIIEASCRIFDLDQRVILIALQREQSAVAAKRALPNRKMMRILGFGCFDGSKKGAVGYDNERFYGFTKQIANAARRYVELAKEWAQGSKIDVDFRKDTVAPMNGPTWAYYRYTPHTHAGRISYLIGRSFFGF